MSTKKSNPKSIDELFQNLLHEVFDRLYKVTFANASDELKSFLTFHELNETKESKLIEAFFALSKEAQEEHLKRQTECFFHAFYIVESEFISHGLISETDCKHHKSDWESELLEKNKKFYGM